VAAERDGTPDLSTTTDATVWAEEFVRTIASAPGADPTDTGFMANWFAAAMTAAEREARRHPTIPRWLPPGEPACRATYEVSGRNWAELERRARAVAEALTEDSPALSLSVHLDATTAITTVGSDAVAGWTATVTVTML
jgi:hypothetical protein